MACHGCYDAPCQLKLDDWLGFERGGSKKKVYDGTRLISANLTRLYEDAHDIEGWREKGFFPVIDREAMDQSLFHKMLQLKQDYPLPTKGPLGDNFDFALNRDQSCPSPNQFSIYAKNRPYQGMPFGFPAVSEEEHAALTDWLAAGAPGAPVTQRSAAEQRQVDTWEAFLNGKDNKSQLMSRYIYEHLFIGDLYFSGLPESGWYKLVRSRTPPGQPIDLIATRRPYDDPGVSKIFYRLQQRYTARLAKRHMPYALNEQRLDRWAALFLEPEYTVASLPGFEGKHDTNPFIAFEQLPVEARYRFMLEEAHFTIMAYIKGPVCRGQVALNVIDDHFWVAFVKPNPVDPEQSAAFLAREAKTMRLPQPKGSLVVTLLQWRRYAKDQKRYLEAEAKARSKLIDRGELDINVDLLWDGGAEQNPNAALTIFRHFDAATVSQGFIGQEPKTVWIIDYSLLERIHYLLVAGFDVYGTVGHQLESRLYMDFLRMEGEQNFLLFLPAEDRKALRNHWYRGAQDHVREYVLPEQNARFERSPDIDFQTDSPKTELIKMIKARVPATRNPRWSVDEPELGRLMSYVGKQFSFLPEVSFLQVLRSNGERDAYSLVHNIAHSNIAQLFNEEDRLLPNEDTLTVSNGFIGSYPNMFFQVHEQELGKFVTAITELADEADYTRLAERWGVRRTDPAFWRVSDSLVEHYRETQPVEAGLFDLNRYQNR